MPVETSLFAEGLARVGRRLIVLTWQEEVALVFDIDSFQRVGESTYTGEGWGLCYDGSRLVMSDGSSNLVLRDPGSFDTIGVVPVSLQGRPVGLLNELECVHNHVYANVWQTDTIVRINVLTGQVDATIDASGLLSPSDRAGADALNGIAHDPGRGTFWLTGKSWPKLFEVRFVESSP